jgi:DNA-binding NarL/FixJ family response regulator
MDLVVRGLPVKAIAHRLGMAESTARLHRDRAVAKYGTGSAVAAAVIHDRRTATRRRPRRAVRGQTSMELVR